MSMILFACLCLLCWFLIQACHLGQWHLQDMHDNPIAVHVLSLEH